MSDRIIMAGDLARIVANVDGSSIKVVVRESTGSGGGGPALSDATPQSPGAPTSGVAVAASRGDHVHAPPTAAQVGAATPADVTAAIAASSLDGGQIQSGFVPDVHIPASIARDSEVTAAVTAHASAADPHGDRAYADAAAAAAQAASQPVDSDLTAIAALSTTSFGRALLEQADAAALRTVAGLGTAATRNVGAGAGTVTAGDDSRLADARTPTAHSHTATDITSGTVATARLGTGAANATTFLRGDGSWAAPAAGDSGYSRSFLLGGM